MTKDVLKLALEALETCVGIYEQEYDNIKVDEAITAIKQALEAPVQESVILKPEHVIVETYSTQKGGFMLKPDNGVRLTHKPTGTVVQCDSERSQHRNRDQAWRNLERNLSDLGWFCAKCPPSRMNQQ